MNMNGNIFNIILYDLKTCQDFHKRADREPSQEKFGNDPIITKYLYEKYFKEDSEERWALMKMYGTDSVDVMIKEIIKDFWFLVHDLG